MVTYKVKDIVNIFHEQAHPDIAYSWDKVGLQIGSPEQKVEKVLLTLDVTEKVINQAITAKVDMIVSHHPFIFGKIESITNQSYLDLIKNDIAVFTSHTNFDIIRGGVNYALAEKLKLKNLNFLSYKTDSKLFQLAVYVPLNSSSRVKKSILEAGAGRIGNYTDCANSFQVKGQFKPQDNSNPAVGQKYKKNRTDEEKLEFLVDGHNLTNTLIAMQAAHPYETPIYTVIELDRPGDNYGLGLIGNTAENYTLETFARFVKEQLQAPFVRLWLADKDRSSAVKRVALCGGSGSSVLAETYGKADIFVSADITYHTMLDSKIPLLNAGHFYTEYPVLEKFEQLLSGLKLTITKVPIQKHDIQKEILV